MQVSRSESQRVLRSGTVLVLFVAAFALFVGGAATWIPARSPASSSVPNSTLATVKPVVELTDSDLRGMLLGTWRLYDHGERVVKNAPDGTATMRVTISFPWSLIYGSRLDLQLTWSVENRILTHTIISGTPEKDVNQLIQDFGAARSSHILSIDAHSLHLEELTTARDRYRWEAIRSGR